MQMPMPMPMPMRMDVSEWNASVETDLHAAKMKV
jgi:hypothetical protein